MKTLCAREPLLNAFLAAAGVAPARSPKPILQGLKFTADADGAATLLATDLELGIRHRVPGVKTDAPGAVILPAQRFGQILRTGTDPELAIEVDGDILTVRGLRSEFKLPSEPPDLFPDVPEFGAGPHLEVTTDDLRRLIRRTAFATDPESTRYALGGVLFAWQSDTLTAVGTDGRRLATMDAPAVAAGAESYTLDGSPVVPVKALKLIDRVCGGDGETVRLRFTKNAVHIRAGGVTVYSRLVEGRFPRYQDVIPADPAVRIPFGVGTLRTAVEQAAVTTSEETRGIDFVFGGGSLTLSGQSADVGRSRVETPIDYDGAPVSITFDGRYLLDALKVLDDGSTVTAELIDGKNAAAFRTEDGYTYVVMPLTRDR